MGAIILAARDIPPDLLEYFEPVDVATKKDVFTIGPQPLGEEHYAAFPEKLVAPMVLAGCPEGGTVLDPFLGSGTVALVSKRLDRSCIGIELNPAYCQLAQRRVDSVPYPLFSAAGSSAGGADGAAR